MNPSINMDSLKCFVYWFLLLAPTIQGYRRMKHDGAEIILAKAAETVDIVCENEVPLVRCGFTHPNGTKILFVNVVPGTPSCKFTTDAIASEEGLWTCHLWTPTSPQEEIQKTVELRVAHKFAALDRELGVKEGERVTFSCISSEGMSPLNECYFTSPGNIKIHMDDKTTEENMVLNNYFFPANRSIHRGDCSITIMSVTSSDAGAWSCAGWLELDNREYSDTVHLDVYGDNGDIIDADHELSISITAYVCGSIAFLCLFAILLYCKEKYLSRFYGKTWGDDDSIENYKMMGTDSLIQLEERMKYPEP